MIHLSAASLLKVCVFLQILPMWDLYVLLSVTDILENSHLLLLEDKSCVGASLMALPNSAGLFQVWEPWSQAWAFYVYTDVNPCRVKN